ncbi:MAG: secretin N-terminal domain-containing protein [Oligoflexus sp.]
MKEINRFERNLAGILAMLVAVLFAAFSCSTSESQQQQNGIPENIASAANFTADLENFTVAGEDNFLDDNLNGEENFLAEDQADESNLFSGSGTEQSFLDEFSNNVAFQESLAENNVPLEFEQSAEEVNSSLMNDTQNLAFEDNNSFAGNAAFAEGNSSLIAEEPQMNSEIMAMESTDIDQSFFATNSVDAAVAGQSVTENFSDNFFNSSPSIPDDSSINIVSPPMAEADNTPDPIQEENIPETVAATEESMEVPVQMDVLPTLHVLTWVGYEIDELNKQLRVEIITRGNPEFQVYQESNQSGQVELVFRFLQTSLRRKIRWDIDASEFRSPVAYVRMRQDKGNGLVDVVLTLRDQIQPLFFAKDGNIQLTFQIPQRYFDDKSVADVQAVDQAQALNQYQLVLDVQEGSDLPKVSQFQPDPAGGMFEDQSINAMPLDRVMEPAPQMDFDDQGFPPSFDSGWLTDPQDHQLKVILPDEKYTITRFSIGSVGQDDLSDDDFTFGDEGFAPVDGDFVFEDQNSGMAGDMAQDGNMGMEANAEQNSLNDQAGNAFDMDTEINAIPSIPGSENFNAAAPDDFFFNAMDGNNSSATGMEEIANDGFTDGGMNFQGENNFVEPMMNNPAPVNAARPNRMFNESELTNAAPANPVMQNMENGFSNLPSAPEIVGTESNQRPQTEYDGRLVFMEFTEAPLSLVFKTFSAETNNNFVFPKDVGDLPVTIHFQGVPWDEALKAILETHSLGMVRVGNNVVRVDAIEKLTNYMQKLEEAKQFETRRVPTKVLVIRLNNAKANDILERLTPILERDREVDPRIRLAADERTNSIVMEAPEYILSKTKNVIERLDLETPQVEIASRIVEVQKNNNDFFGAGWINRALANFDPGRGLGFGSLNFPNNMVSSFAVDPGVVANPSVGNAQFRFGSINRFIDLDLILRMEERRGTTNILQSNRVLVLDGQDALILAGNSKFFRPAAGGTVVNQGDAGGGDDPGLAEVQFNLSLEVTPQVTADGSVIMNLIIKSDTPGDPTGEVLADKNTRELRTQMIRESGDTGVIGGIYDTQRIESIVGVPFFSKLPIIGALFRATNTVENQTELLIMVTPTIVSGRGKGQNMSANNMGGSNFAPGNSFGGQNSSDNFFGGNGANIDEFDSTNDFSESGDNEFF